jgi:hypothetical protein
VFPSLDRLVCYTQDLSHLDIGQFHVHALPAEMFAERLGSNLNAFPPDQPMTTEFSPELPGRNEPAERTLCTHRPIAFAGTQRTSLGSR